MINFTADMTDAERGDLLEQAVMHLPTNAERIAAAEQLIAEHFPQIVGSQRIVLVRVVAARAGMRVSA